MDRDEHDVKTLWAAIADPEARLLALVKGFAQIVWVTDRNGNVLSDAEPPPEIADLTWSAFTGLSRRNLIAGGWAAALHPEDRPVVAASIQQAKTSGMAIECEFRIRHYSGDWRWVICRGTPVRSPAGEIEGWIGSCIDITNGKQTEAAYRESQQRLIAALDAGGMSTWIWELSDHSFSWDEAGEKLWGSVGATRSGKLRDLMPLIHVDDRATLIKACDDTIATGVAHGAEFRTVRPDGRLQWLQSRGRVEHDANGVPVRVIGAFIDVTRRKTTEESLRQGQKMQALGTLAGGIAHDFNNLLLAISGNTQLALTDLDVRHPVHESLREIAKASARASDLVRRILTFSASQPAALAITPLRPALEEALTLLRSNVPQNVQIRTHFNGPAFFCTLGQAELHQLIVNLVNNAIHAIADRDGRIDITVDFQGDGSDLPLGLAAHTRYARMQVRDTGAGMDAATRVRIFEPFFTTKPLGKGTGLGLAVVHGIVHSAGGALTVESEPGRGTTFTVWLPLAPENAEVPEAAPASTSRHGGGKHILYVDDDEAIVFLIKRLLEKSGYRVTCCADPSQAQRLFAAHPEDFDVVVTDLAMPTMNGFDLIDKLRAIRADLPVIMTSGYVRDEDQLRAAQLEIGRIILKPNTVDELGSELDARCAQLAPR